MLSLLLAAKHPDDVHGTALLAPTFWLNGWLIPWHARLFRMVFSKRLANLIGFPDLHPHGIKDQRIRDFIRNALFSGDSSDGRPAQHAGRRGAGASPPGQRSQARLENIHQPA